jgi:hypothetical protein
MPETRRRSLKKANIRARILNPSKLFFEDKQGHDHHNDGAVYNSIAAADSDISDIA